MGLKKFSVKSCRLHLQHEVSKTYRYIAHLWISHHHTCRSEGGSIIYAGKTRSYTQGCRLSYYYGSTPLYVSQPELVLSMGDWLRCMLISFLLQQCSSRPSFSVEILSMICVSYHLHAVGNALCNRRPWSEQKQPCHAVLVVHLYQVSLQRIEPIIISKIDNLSTCRNMVQVVSISLLLINLLSCNFHTNRKGYNARPAHYCSST